MQLININAFTHPLGNRIDLNWEFPGEATHPGIRVMRREGTHPVSPRDGVLVDEGIGLQSVTDSSLKAETVYYYSMFPYKNDPPEFAIDVNNRTSALATANYNSTGQLYELLPGIYHRYDTNVPGQNSTGLSDSDKTRGQLHRFLDLPGSQFDLFYSCAKAMLDMYNVDRIDGQLLSLLAQWIGWQTDYGLEYETQRNDLKNAPHVYRTIGLNPTVEATIKRVTGWNYCRVKEFVHNVFLSNKPERYNIWLKSFDGSTESREPLSLDFAYEGRPSIVKDN
ncbi:MAG: hypothetical protein GY869_13440, partial [Planctomycetes bacterium]|nr:hypothetical protein [Planctomycetota bacterium]